MFRGLFQALLALSMSFLVAGTALAQPAATGPFNVRTLGAMGDGVTDDTAAFNAAITAVPPSGGEIYVPAGRYKLTNTLTITGKSIAFRGEGQRNSTLVWSGAPTWAPGILFSGTGLTPMCPSPGMGGPPPQPPTTTLTVRSIALLRAGNAGGAAISGSWPAMPPCGAAQMYGGVSTTIEDVLIASDPWPMTSNNYWAWGIRLANSVSAKINTFTILGPGAGGGYAGISIGGTFNNDDTIDTKSFTPYIRDGDISSYARGIEVKNHAEGLHFHGLSIRDTFWGIQFTDVGPGTAVAHCQLSAQSTGIEMNRAVVMAVTDNTIYQEPGQGNFAGIHISGGTDLRVIGNTVVGASGLVGIGVDGVQGAAANSIIHGNTSSGVAYGIWLNGTPGPSFVSGFLVDGNVNRATTAALVNTGTSNQFVNNY